MIRINFANCALGRCICLDDSFVHGDDQVENVEFDHE